MLLRREGLDQQQDPFWIYATDSGKILEASVAALAFLETTREELLGQCHTRLRSPVWEFADGQLRSIRASPQTGKAEKVAVCELDILIDGHPCRLVMAPREACRTASTRLRPTGHEAGNRPEAGRAAEPEEGAAYPRRRASFSEPGLLDQKLNDSERQLDETRAYLENTRSLLEVCSWRYHYNTGRIEWSSNAARVLRLDTDAVPQTLADYIELIHPEDREGVQTAFRNFRNGDASELNFTYRLVRSTLRPVHVRGKGTLVDTSAGMTLTGVVQNITEEAASKSEMEMLRHCLARVNDIIIVTEAEPLDNPEGPRIIYANAAFERQTGYTLSEALGATPRLLQGPESDAGELRRIRDALEQWKPVRSEILNYTKQGVPFWVELDIVPVSDGNGRNTHWIAVQRDITERRRAEEGLRKSERLQALGHLTGGIAHDFNNFLTVMLGNSETLAAKLPEGPLRELALLSVEASENAADLVRSLLAFARRQRLEPVTLDVNARILQFSRILRRTLPENISVALDLQPDLSSIEVDPGQLESCLLNLCVNARDAMTTGGTITIRTETTQIGLEPEVGSPLPPGVYSTIRIQDTGTGMSAEELKHAFDPFFTTKQTGAGSGLGLASVYGFVSQSGGHVSIDSAPGAGTCVRLDFPEAGPVTSSPAEPVPIRPAPLPFTKVLVVEDNPLVLAHVSRLLEQMGMDIVTAVDGPSAVNRLLEHADLEVLFTDIVLPGDMDGFRIAEEARRLRPGIKVIYTSGYSEITHTQGGELDPEISLLRKPYSKLKLVEKFEDLLLSQGPANA